MHHNAHLEMFFQQTSNVIQDNQLSVLLFSVYFFVAYTPGRLILGEILHVANTCIIQPTVHHVSYSGNVGEIDGGKCSQTLQFHQVLQIVS